MEDPQAPGLPNIPNKIIYDRTVMRNVFQNVETMVNQVASIQQGATRSRSQKGPVIYYATHLDRTRETNASEGNMSLA